MNDYEKLKYDFEELIKTLIILSLPANKQLEVMSFGDEMAIDFDIYYSDLKDEYIQVNLINTEQKNILDKIDNFFDERSGKHEYLDFWLDSEQLLINPDWEKIRDMAKESLIVLKKENLDLKVVIENNYSDNLTVQSLQINLIEKYK